MQRRAVIHAIEAASSAVEGAKAGLEGGQWADASVLAALDAARALLAFVAVALIGGRRTACLAYLRAGAAASERMWRALEVTIAPEDLASVRSGRDALGRGPLRSAVGIGGTFGAPPEPLPLPFCECGHTHAEHQHRAPYGNQTAAGACVGKTGCADDGGTCGCRAYVAEVRR